MSASTYDHNNHVSQCQRPPSFLVHEHTSRSMLKGSRDSFVFMLKVEAHTHGRDCHFVAEKGAGSISEHVLNSWYYMKTHGLISSSSLWPLPLFWQKRISLQTDNFCRPGSLRSNSPVPLSCLYRHISQVEPQKKARGGQQEGNQRAGGCACGSFWERPGWRLARGRGQESVEAQRWASQNKRIFLTAGHGD